MKQKQIVMFNQYKNNSNDIVNIIMNHCIFDELTGQFKCKKSNCVVYVDWSRNYAFCAMHGIIN